VLSEPDVVLYITVLPIATFLILAVAFLKEWAPIAILQLPVELSLIER